MTDRWLLLLLPSLPLAVALAGFVAPLSPRALMRLTPPTGLAVLGLALAVVGRVLAEGPIAAGSLYADGLSALLLTVIGLVAFFACLHSGGYMLQDLAEGRLPPARLRWYHLWFHAFIGTMCAVAVAGNLGILWVAVEGTTLATAFLVGFYNTKQALEAAWKYMILCTVGIAIALLGTIFFYFAALPALGSERALLWPALLAAAPRLDPGLVRLAFVLVLVGYGTKAGLAPLHNWLPDAHSQAPAPVSALLSGVLISSAFYSIVRFFTVAVAALGPAFPATLMILLGALSVAVAALFVLVQRDFKRLLAYSSIEHMGLMAIGVGLAASGGAARVAAFGVALHLLSHACTKSMLFFSAGNLAQGYATRLIERVEGSLKALPLSGATFLLGTLAIAGLPPFGLFPSELALFQGGFGRGAYLLMGSILFLLAVTFAGMVYHALRMSMGYGPAAGPRCLEAVREAAAGREACVGRDHLGVAALLLPLGLTLFLGLFQPAPLTRLLTMAASVMGGGAIE